VLWFGSALASSAVADGREKERISGGEGSTVSS